MPTDNNDPVKSLVSRQEAESRFYDKLYVRRHDPHHYVVRPTYPIWQRMIEMAGDLSGRCVLEYGCGEGWITRNLARKGALVSAFDISAEAVQRTCAVLNTAGFSDQCKIAKMGAETLNYPDESFDVAVGFAIMHHLDLNLAIPELYRVLKPGGVAYFAEPLGTNPIINLYRRLTPLYRTKDEKPLYLKLIIPLLSPFRELEHKEFYVTALLSVALVYLPFGKKLFPFFNRQLMKFDDWLLSKFPFLGCMGWYTIIKLKK